MEKKKIQILKSTLFFIVVGIVIYVFRSQFPPIIKEIKSTNISIILFVSIMGLMYQFFDGLSLRSIAKKLDFKMSIFDAFRCSLYSAFYRVITFGSATYISIIYFFKKLGLEAMDGFSISTVNYIAQRIAVVITSLTFYLMNYDFMKKYFSKYTNYLLFGILFTGIVVIFLILISASEKFHKLIMMIFKLDKKGRFVNIKRKLEDSLNVNSTKDLLVDKVLFLKIILLNILKLFCWYLIPYIIFRGKFDYTLFDYVSITALVVSLLGVIPAPGGMGSTEFVFGMLFSKLMNTNSAMSGMFLYRFANFIIPTVFGALVAIIMKFSKK